MYHAYRGEHKRIAGLSLREAAHLLGGKVCGDHIRAPGPGHSSGDDSLIVFHEPKDLLGFRTHSHAGDPFRACREHVLDLLGIPAAQVRSRRHAESIPRHAAKFSAYKDASKIDRERQAQWLWISARPIADTPAVNYLRRRGIEEAPTTLKYLAATESSPHPAILAPFALPVEESPGVLACPVEVKGVLRIWLSPDCCRKIDGQSKAMLGTCAGLPIALTAIGDMGGLAIAEGIEDALSIHAVTGLGVWAAGCASFLPKLTAPAAHAADVITIGVDDDVAGKRYSRLLANALAAKGQEVRLQSSGEL